MANITMEELIEWARVRQQDYYELIPDWIIYETENLKYLKQNISFAMFGMEISETIDVATINAADVTDKIIYSDSRMEVVNMLFEKICKYSQMSEDGNIACGVIYIIVFSHQEKNTVQNEKQILHPVPVFKLMRYKGNKWVKKSSTNTADNVSLLPAHESWYMDTNGRIYKSWTDYKENNTLPKCIMVGPKGGFYQADPSLEITETTSTVWVEIVQSPACKTSKKALKYADIGSSVLGIGGAVVLGIASFVTPIGPIATVAGLATSGVSGLWTAGRCSQELIDRSIHEESIKDRNAVGAWLGIAGSAFGMAAGGGAFAIARSVQKGAVVGKVWQAAYNTALVGDIAVNAIGIGHQGYCIYHKYHEDDVSTMDVLVFATHVLFFGSTVVGCRFAKNIIESTQGNILKDYEASLRSKRHRKSYNRVKRNAAKNSSCKINENAEIIRHIKKVNTAVDLIPGYKTSSSKVVMKFENGYIKINGVNLIDPVLFVTKLHKQGVLTWDADNKSLNDAINNNPKSNSSPDFLYRVLEEILSNLRSRYPKTEEFPVASAFAPIINEIRFTDNPADVLTKLFQVAFTLYQKRENIAGCLVEAVRFVWDYFKENLKQSGMKLCSYVSNPTARQIFEKVIVGICTLLDMIIPNLIIAFRMYLERIL